MTKEIRHFVAGGRVPGVSGRFGGVFNPTTGEVQAKVALASRAEVGRIVDAAEKAFPAWAATNPQRRARVMMKFLDLVQKDMDNIARMLSSEHGKILPDSRGDIQRGLEVIEFACGIPHLQKGEYTEQAGPGIDVYSLRQPLGVCAGMTPFNFPAMIPMWMFGVAIACGNTFVLKPSEKDPSVPVRLAELMMEAGAPEGVLNVVHGDKEAVDAIIAHPEIKAVMVQANETSTGVCHPVKELAAVTKTRPGTILIVDAISALGGYELPMDEWGIDVQVAGSQKAMMLPPGLAFAALSPKAWEFVRSGRLFSSCRAAVLA